MRTLLTKNAWFRKQSVDVYRRGFADMKVINPYNSKVVATLPLMKLYEINSLLKRSRTTQELWKQTSLADRMLVFEHFVEYFKQNGEDVAKEISQQMGKPYQQGFNEMKGLTERTKAFVQMAPRALGSDTVENDEKFIKVIRKEPKGVVMSLAPWNYPLLTAVNSVVPAILAGNSVVLSHGFRCPLTSIRFKNAIQYSVNQVFGENNGFDDLLLDFHLNLATLEEVLKKDDDTAVDFVSFTGSTKLGRKIYGLIGQNRLIDCTLELGGSDACYISEKTDEKTLNNAIETAVDGAFYNAGQSCCGIERCFVHEDIYEKFMEGAIKATNYKLGDPFDSATNMGPMISKEKVKELENIVQDAVSKGAKVVVGGKSKDGVFFEPTILENCDDSMLCMNEEVFGPILSVAKVSNEDDAIRKMNASKYGLTAAVFTNDLDQAERMFPQLKVGTVFMNRADYLEPYMPWQGRKETGKGCSLGEDGFRGFYNLKNAHFKLKV